MGSAAPRPNRMATASPSRRIEAERWSWPLQAVRPHPALRPLLARDYWGITAEAPSHQLVIPATTAVPLVIKMCDSPNRPTAFLHGTHERFLAMDGDCAASYLEIVMAPLGAYQLLGRPVQELGGELVDAHDIFGADARRLVEAVREERTWPARFAVLDRFLLAAADRGPSPAPQVRRAWHLITSSGGREPIGRIAADVGWSHKHLITKFTQQVGVTPKTAARLARFERVLTMVRTGQAGPWGRLAADAGYADQPHLIREFREFAGITPAGFPTPATSASDGTA